MIGHVAPLDLSTPGMNPLGPLTSTSARAGDSAGMSSAVGSSSFAGAISGLQINTAVSQLLEGIGGTEANRTLQMLIALLILVTLLQGSQDTGDTAGTLADLAQRGVGSGGYLGIAMSSTTVTVEQTSILYSASTAGSSAGTEDPTSSRGRHLDLAA